MGPAPHLTARVDTRDGIVSIAFTGSLDLATLPDLQRHLAAVDGDTAEIVLDLRDVAFTDSTGVHALVTAKTRVATAGQQLMVIGARPVVRRVFELTGTAGLLNDGDAAGLLHRFATGTDQELIEDAHG